jgi:serine protease Do
VQDVTPDTPAATAGLRPYDVVVRADGRAVESDDDLIQYISSRPPGTLARLDVWRDGVVRTVPVKLRDRPLPPAVRRRARPDVDVRPARQDGSVLGLEVRDLDAATADRLRIPDTIEGVLVTDVDATGPARLAQIKTNQVLLEINRRRVVSVAEYHTVVDTLRRSDAAALLLFDRSTGQRIIATVIPDDEP